jgi:hypothetical protein
LQSKHIEKIPAQRGNVRRIKRFDGNAALQHDLSKTGVDRAVSVDANAVRKNKSS